MIASIDSQQDITIYLEKPEIEKLLQGEVSGTLIDIARPKRQSRITLYVDGKKATDCFNGIHVDNPSTYEDLSPVAIYLKEEVYQTLTRKGIIAKRYSASKIEIFDTAKLDPFEREDLEGLLFYEENKDKLPDSFG